MWALCYCKHLQYTTSRFKAAWYRTNGVVSFGQDNRHDRSEQTPPETRHKSRLNVTALVTIVKKQNKDWIGVKRRFHHPHWREASQAVLKSRCLPKIMRITNSGDVYSLKLHLLTAFVLWFHSYPLFSPHTFNELSWHNVRNFQSSNFCNLRVLIKHQWSLGKPGHSRDKPL